ncbi:hypothetical protein WA026_003767 [Henosepilachna vigintioctopunctata]|uniref:C2H2-type domain-containing protein n=1 Tax=Henosepilachna vigintioctopunctata TaxID=420089 RepID=A0AAW1UDY1_9CUCU
MDMEEENLFCMECQMRYSNLSSFRKHVRKLHPTKLQILTTKSNDQISKFSCETCRQSFSAARTLTIHRKSCHIKPVEDVIKCKEETISRRTLLEDENIACSDCELEFDDLVSFKQHMRDHRDNRLTKVKKTKKNGLRSKVGNKSNEEKRTNTQNKSLSNVHKEHKEETSPVRKSRRSRKPVSYAYLIESGSDSENESLASRLNKIIKIHVCNKCHMEYNNLNDLQKHIRKHHPSKLDKSIKTDKTWKKVKLIDKKFVCEACLTKCNTLSSLRKHIRKYHPSKWPELSAKLYNKKTKSSDKMYTCSECQALYGNVVGLRKHIRRNHPSKFIELASGLYKKKPRSTEKNITCSDCQMKYSTIGSLRKHVKKLHPSKFLELLPMLYKKKGNFKRDISCTECDMKYSNMSGLRKHIRKHHASKLVELAPLLYTFKRNMAKNILLKRRNLKECKIEHLMDVDLIDMDKYKCYVCESSYSNISNLRKHLRKFHPEKLSDIAPLLKDNTNFKYPCDQCSKKFNCIRNFKYHQRKCHPDIAQPITRISKPSKINKCPLCSFGNPERKMLLHHFKEEHDIEVTMKPVEVTTPEEFFKWKDSFEKETNTKFVKEYHFSCTSHDVVSYICHRSGYYNPKGKGLRHMKAQGSSKINGYCPAAMKLKKLKDNTVKVTFCETHVGHNTDVSHLHLTPAERQIIAEKIAMNIPFDEILESIRDTVSESEFKRIHMLSKKDLYNIKSSFHLASPVAKTVKPQTENISFEVWIEETKKKGDCNIFYKQQGQYLAEHPNLKHEDFVLIVMNQTQREKLKKFGQDLICLDRSFDLNSHQFELISLLVLNEAQEGFPCAFLISNRTDQEIMTLFFQYIRNIVGRICTKMFMSDMVDYFYIAWCAIMPATQISFRFYCTWQIEHAWRKKVSSIKSKEKQELIMAKLKQVLEEKHISSFKEVLESVIAELNTESYTWDFSNYLSQNYLQENELWTPKDDVYTDIKFNFHLERMHKTLKHLFLNGKNAKHFGKALGDIMRFLKDKLFDRTILINRGKINNKMKIAIFRHKLSLHSKEDEITKSNDEWLIPSSETTEIYKITEIQPSCRCEFICTECKTCIHRFVCTCLDSSVKWNMCKHIHLLCRYLNNTESSKHQTQQLSFLKQHALENCNQQQQLVYVKRSPQVEFCKHPTSIVEYVKQHPTDVGFIKQQSQQIEHVQVQHIQVENHVGHVDQVEGTYIYCNETNQREMDAILAEVNICNLETVQVTQIPTSCTIQIPTTCTVVPQVEQITAGCSDAYEVVDTKESLKIKFSKLLEEASSSELEVVQKMLASIAPTLEVIKGSSSDHQVLFPL